MTVPRSGGRRRGIVYDMPPPRMLGDRNWPHQTFERQTDPVTRKICECWRDLVVEIRIWRDALGLTQPDIAKKAGIAQNAYEAIEGGDAWGTLPRCSRSSTRSSCSSNRPRRS